jgi:biopolymer transport protein ExbD
MEFSQPKPRRQTEPALPMINVVFLLLIFFLMSAQIVPAPPFAVTPPSADAAAAPAEDLRLHLAADGAIALAGMEGAAVWDHLAILPEPAGSAILIRADGQMPAAELAAVLARLSALGFAQIQLATVPK